MTDIITYIKLRPQATEEQATKALNALLKANMPEDVSRKRSIQLDPLEDYYLVTNNGSVRSLIISLAVIVAFILLLAVANFINITIAGSFSRLKEVGVRKVIGGVRRQVIIQFFRSQWCWQFYLASFRWYSMSCFIIISAKC
ncbi:MAG: FtsX-like permease family protein [Bacteroidota bacterium]